MARPPRNEAAAADFGEHLAKLAAANPRVHNAKVIERWFWKWDLSFATETIRKAHAGQVDPTTTATDLLVGLAAYYQVPPAELGEHAAHRIVTLLAMAELIRPGAG